MPGSLRRGVILSFLLGILVFVGIAVYGDAREVSSAFSNFRRSLLLPSLLLGLGALVLRGVRWHWFLSLVGGQRLPPWRSAQVFAAGTAMQVTPGRVGEWVKSYYVEALGGPPAARTSPIVLAERITDMLGLVLLAASGLLVYRTAFWVVAVSALIAGGLLFSLVHDATAALVSRTVARLPLVRQLVPHVEEFYGAARLLLTPRTLVVGAALAFASWVCEAAAFWCVLWGVGAEPSWTLLYVATFIWPVASLAGGLFLTPGGLGVAEGGLTGLTQALVDGLGRGPAAAAALLARLATLWLGVALGLLAMAALSRTTRAATPAVGAAPSGPAAPHPAAGAGDPGTPPPG